MMSLFLLAGCAGGGGERTGEDLALTIREEYGQLTAVTCHVALTAERGEETFDCALDVVWDQATGAGLTLTEPEIVRGVTARIAQGATSLEYDGFSLEIGPLAPEGLSPMEAVPTLWRQILEGYIAGARLEEGILEVTYRQGEAPPGTGLEAVVTFDVQSHAPLTGELFYDGTRIVTAQVSDFQSMGGPGQG